MKRYRNITILLILFVFTVGSGFFHDVQADARKVKMVVHALKDGRGLAGVAVTFKNSTTGNTGTRKTDASGKCSDFFGTPGITYVVTASKAGYKFDASPMKFVLGTKTKKIYFKTVGKPVAKKTKAVAKKARMVVHALQDGRGLEGVTVTFKNNTTGNTGRRKTDASGKCSDFFGTPGIGYVVTASKAGYKFDVSPMKFILGTKTKQIYFKTVGKPLARKSEAVPRKVNMVVHTLQDGRGLEGVTVTYKNNNTGNTGRRKTDASGKCSDYFGTPGVAYVVTASKAGYKFDANPMKFILGTKTKNIYFKTVGRPVQSALSLDTSALEIKVLGADNIRITEDTAYEEESEYEEEPDDSSTTEDTPDEEESSYEEESDYEEERDESSTTEEATDEEESSYEEESDYEEEPDDSSTTEDTPDEEESSYEEESDYEGEQDESSTTEGTDDNLSISVGGNTSITVGRDGTVSVGSKEMNVGITDDNVSVGIGENTAMTVGRDGTVSVDRREMNVGGIDKEVSLDESSDSIAYELKNVMVEGTGKGEKITITHELGRKATSGESNTSYNPKEISNSHFFYELKNVMVKASGKGEMITITHELDKRKSGSKEDGFIDGRFAYELKNVMIKGADKGDKLTIIYELGRKTKDSAASDIVEPRHDQEYTGLEKR